MQTASYIVNEQGQKTGVILGMAEYLKMLEAVEELEAIKAYDSAKAEGGEAIPFDLALAEIAADRERTLGRLPTYA